MKLNLAKRAEAFLGQGIHEVSGPSSHPQILAWLKRTEKLFPTDLKIDDSTYAWCGVFVGNLVLDARISGEDIPEPPNYFQGAARWAKYGKSIKIDEGQPGDIAVMSRVGGSHVTIISARVKGGYVCTGGNQSDSVNQTTYPYNKLIAVRRP